MTPDEPIEDKQTKVYRASKILNYIGGTLVFFGICYWLSFNWYVLSAIGRVVLTPLALPAGPYSLPFPFLPKVNIKLAAAHFLCWVVFCCH